MNKKFSIIPIVAILLSGCNVNVDASEPPKGYDSSITLQAEVSTLITDCTQIAEYRLMLEYPELESSISYPDPETSVIEFNRPENWDERSLETLCRHGELTFRKGTETATDSDGQTIPSGEILLQNTDIATAWAVMMSTDLGPTYVVNVKMSDIGRDKFAAATEELAGTDTPISIWYDNDMISAPTVNTAITNGEAIISGNFTVESANELAVSINSGTLPCGLTITDFKIGEDK